MERENFIEQMPWTSVPYFISKVIFSMCKSEEEALGIKQDTICYTGVTAALHPKLQRDKEF